MHVSLVCGGLRRLLLLGGVVEGPGWTRVWPRLLQSSSASAGLKRTALHDLWVESQAIMAPFAGWSMPMSFSMSATDAHRFVREKCGMFDVSHMLQFVVHGEGAQELLEELTPSDLAGLKNNCGTYSMLLNERGGIEDDVIINKINHEHFYVVSNAGRADHVRSIVSSKLRDDARYSSRGLNAEFMGNRTLIAIQGPLSARVIKPAVDIDLDKVKFMMSSEVRIFGISARLTRCGYTGEDGFEVSFENSKAAALVKNLVSLGGRDMCLAGLATRDSLRLEAGLCLYGTDIDSSRTPVEAGLLFAMSKKRRKAMDFPGAEVIMAQVRDGPALRRVGFVSDNRIPRSDMKLFDATGAPVGNVTSGGRSPTLSLNIGMGYVSEKLSRAGSTCMMGLTHDKASRVTITELPFVPTKYYR